MVAYDELVAHAGLLGLVGEHAGRVVQVAHVVRVEHAAQDADEQHEHDDCLVFGL